MHTAGSVLPRSNLLRVFIGILFISTKFVGCAAIQSGLGGEPGVTKDATPPPQYAPVYVHAVSKLPTNPSQVRSRPVLEITRIDAREPNHVRIYVHLIDSNGSYLSGASLAKYRSSWCTFDDKLVGGSPVEIKKYKLTEVTENMRVPTALAIVMDHSGSMGEERVQVLEEAAGDLIDTKRPEDAFSIIKFDNKVKVEVPLTTDVSEMRSKFLHNGLMDFGGGTALLDGIAAGLNSVEMDSTEFDHRVVALFTDGMDNSSTANRDSLLRIARHSNVTFLMIGFGDGINESFLRYLATSAGGSYRHIYKTHEIGSAIEDLYKRLHNYYEFEYAPISYGLHSVTIGLCLPDGNLVATGSYDNTPNLGDVAKLDVYFDVNSSKLLPISNAALESAVRLMNAYPQMKIELQGHTDSTNHTKDPDFNKKLSQKRSKMVKAALVKRGIDEERITAVGYGATHPIADNTTEEGRAKNRRTEFVIESE